MSPHAVVLQRGPFLLQEGKLSPTVASVTEHPIRPGLDPGLLTPVRHLGETSFPSALC